MSSTLVRRQRLQVFYDADCGFCARSARVLRRLDRRHRLQLTPLQVAAGTVPDAPPPDVLARTMHLRDAAGHWTTGGEAWIRISREIGLLRPLGLLARLPLVRSLVEPTYALIAANRQRIGRLLGDDACDVDLELPAGHRL